MTNEDIYPRVIRGGVAQNPQHGPNLVETTGLLSNRTNWNSIIIEIPIP